jgi:hypothetical protein
VIGCCAPTWSPDGSRIGFVGRSDTFGLFTIYSLKPDGTDLVRHTINRTGIFLDPYPFGGARPGAVHRLAWGKTCTSIVSCSALLTVVQQGPSGFVIESQPQLAAAASIGFLVEKYSGRRLRRVGRVPFGNKRRGRQRVRWNLELAGRRLGPGRYRISLRSLAGDVPLDVAKRRDLIVPLRGKPRLTRPRIP